jgi:hypothetical protein
LAIFKKFSNNITFQEIGFIAITKYKKKVFVSDLWNFLKEQNIIFDKDASHLNPETFIFYIEKLKALNAKDKAEYIQKV